MIGVGGVTDGADRLDAVMANLPCPAPRAAQAARTRARAHARLDRRVRRRRVAVIALSRRHRALVELAVAGACGLFYLAEVVRRAMEWWE